MKIRNTLTSAILASTIVVLKEVMAFLPNIEPVTLFLVVITMTFSLRDSLMTAGIYVAIETVLYGIGIHTMPYIFVWLFIVFVTSILKNWISSYFKAAVLAFFFGLFFDLPFSIPFFMLGINSGISYLLNGTVYSLIHAFGNFIIFVLLYDVLLKRMKELHLKYHL